MSGREELLKQIRYLGRGTRGAPPAILELPDAALYELFLQMQRRVSNRAIARYLRKTGMKGSENSLQQTLSLFRKRIAPLLGEESASQSLPQAALKIPAEVSSLPADEMLSTVTDIVKAYGESIRQATVAAAKNGTPLSEDLAKHIKSYSGLVATQARLEQTVMKSRPVALTEDPSFEERANRAWEQLTDNGRDTDSMAKMVDKFLMRLEKKCIQLEQDSNGEWVEAPPQRPGRRRTGGIPDDKFSID
jgi:hypothetical protein